MDQRPKCEGSVFGPALGTASLARQIQLDEEDLPRPLRSESHPDGLPGLTGTELARVEAANILCQFVAVVADECSNLGKPFAIENPRSSLFWLVTPMVDRQFSHLDFEQSHQACAYGSERPKWTKILSNFEEIHTICLTCPGNHIHAQWGTTRKGAK